MRCPVSHPGRGQAGFALIAVLLVLAIVGVIGAEFAYSMRLEATSVRSYKETLIASHLAEAAVEQAIREIAGDVAFAATAADGTLTFYTRDRLELKRLPRMADFAIWATAKFVHAASSATDQAARARDPNPGP